MSDEQIRAALKKAFSFGERHWQQADSEYVSHHRKADETMAKFNAFVEETIAALAQRSAKPVAIVDAGDDGYFVEILPDRSVKVGQELYTAPPAADGRDVNGDFISIPKAALDWLLGEAGEFVCPPSGYFRDKPAPYWWRSEFSRRIDAARTQESSDDK